MNRFIRSFVSENRRQRFTNRLTYKMAMGCLGLVFVIGCCMTLIVIYLMQGK
jgi:hypothetical protein